MIRCEEIIYGGKQMEKKEEIPLQEILERLPHRYPFLLIDKILEIDVENKYIKAQKNVSFNEPYFQGHFPNYPIMPGVLILEAMAQTGAIYLSYAYPEYKDKLFVLAGLDKVRFRNPVYPGDILIIEGKEFKKKGNVIKCSGVAKVNDKIVAEAEMFAAVLK